MALNESVAENEIQVARILGKKKLSDNEKNERVRLVRQSMAEIKTGSVGTVFSIANQMIGSSIILYPVLFIQDGVISSALTMLVVGLVQYWTCAILCLHNRPDEMDVNDTIRRILGVKWYKANLITNVLLMYIVCVVYFLLIAVNFYELTATLFESISEGYTPPDPDEIRFDVWSYQWAGIVAMLLLYPLLFVKKIEVLLRFLTFTIYLVLIYLLYILTFAVFNMVNGDIQWGKYTLFSPSFSKVAGAFALSFIVHPVISPYLKKNLNQDKNGRDLFFGYVATAFIYSFVGIFGSFACGKVVEEAENFSTIFQCFQRSSTESWVFWVSKVVQSFILLQNLSAFPIIWFMTRKQFLEVLDKNHPSDRWHLASTVSIIVVSLAVQVFNIPVSAVVSFDGAVVGFVLVYLIPVYMHWKCMYHSYSEEENTQRRIDIEKELSTDNAGLSVSLVDDDESLKCVDHPPKNKRRDMFLYSAIMVFGVAMGIFKILSFITGK